MVFPWFSYGFQIQVAGEKFQVLHGEVLHDVEGAAAVVAMLQAQQQRVEAAAGEVNHVVAGHPGNVVG